MTPEEALRAWARLKTTADGREVVTLMADPDMADGFLSLVDRGANGRRVSVAKVDLDNDELHPQGGNVPDNGFLAAMFGNLLRLIPGLVEPARKGDHPVSFEAAVGVPAFFDALWVAQDGLSVAARNILLDEEIADKGKALREALAGFSAYMEAAISGIPVFKRDDPAIAEMSRVATKVNPRAKTHAAKAGRVISEANLGKITAARSALEGALTALKELEAAGTRAKAKKRDTVPTTDPENDMDIKLAATAAANQAITVAKSAGITDPLQLAEFGSRASTEVFKMAVMGPKQPGIPTDTLQQQMSQAGPTSTGLMPEGALMRAINAGAGTMAKKTDGSAVSTDAEAAEWLARTVKDLAEKADGFTDDKGVKQPGFVEIAEKAMEVATKVAGVPEPSAQVPDQGDKPTGDNAEAGDKTTVRKNELDPLDLHPAFSGLIP